MSWLTQLFGGDDQAETRAIQAENYQRYLAEQRAQQAQQVAKEEAIAAKADLAQTRAGAEATARTGAQRYFSDRGLDPAAYQGDIDTRIAELMASINPSDPAPGAQLQGVGETVYGRAQDAARERALRSFNTAFAPDFEYGRISSTTDDPFIADIVQGERTKADAYLQNLLKRGVINETGYQGGVRNLDEQGAGARSLLNTLGSDILETGRSSLRDIAGRGRTRAATINLGETFDPASYGRDIDTRYNEFLAGLPDQLKAATPTDLYDTSNLSSIAGAAQGAQNLAFDPKALSGILGGDEDEERRRAEEAARGRTSRGVF